VLVSRENAALKRRSSTVVRAASVPGKRAAQKFDHRGHGENAVTLAHGKKFNERVHGENALMPTLRRQEGRGPSTRAQSLRSLALRSG
jgi:hypothetical protein